MPQKGKPSSKTRQQHGNETCWLKHSAEQLTKWGLRLMGVGNYWGLQKLSPKIRNGRKGEPFGNKGKLMSQVEGDINAGR